MTSTWAGKQLNGQQCQSGPTRKTGVFLCLQSRGSVLNTIDVEMTHVWSIFRTSKTPDQDMTSIIVGTFRARDSAVSLYGHRSVLGCDSWSVVDSPERRILHCGQRTAAQL